MVASKAMHWSTFIVYLIKAEYLSNTKIKLRTMVTQQKQPHGPFSLLATRFCLNFSSRAQNYVLQRFMRKERWKQAWRRQELFSVSISWKIENESNGRVTRSLSLFEYLKKANTETSVEVSDFCLP